MALERKKPMTRDTPGARRFAAQRSELKRTEWKRKAPVARTTVQRAARASRTSKANDWHPSVRAAALRRSGGACEARFSVRCSGGAEHAHHRKLRRHRDHTLENALMVCEACHDAIHGSGRKAAGEQGLILKSWQDPATTPVVAGPPRDDVGSD